MLYENIFRTFNELGLKYVIIGGIAVNLHGYDRHTGDLDIVIAMTNDEIQKFIHAVEKLKMLPRMPVKLQEFADPQKRKEWMYEKGMKVFSVYNPHNPIEDIDVVMIEQIIEFDILYTNSVIMKDRELILRIASIPDLIALKKHAGRERDLLDIRALKRLTQFKDE